MTCAGSTSPLAATPNMIVAPYFALKPLTTTYNQSRITSRDPFAAYVVFEPASSSVAKQHETHRNNNTAHVFRRCSLPVPLSHQTQQSLSQQRASCCKYALDRDSPQLSPVTIVLEITSPHVRAHTDVTRRKLRFKRRNTLCMKRRETVKRAVFNFYK